MALRRNSPSFASLKPAALEFIAFLSRARQLRILAKADPFHADEHKSSCRYWLSIARRSQGPPLP